MTESVLFVDDEANVLSAISRQLRKTFDVHTALGGEAGLEVIEKDGPFAVVISDMRMPGMDGIEFLKKVREACPETVRIMLTGNADQQTAINAINEGAIFSFHNKPCPPDQLANAVEMGISQYKLITAERTLLERTLAGSIKVLTDVLSILDPEAFSKSAKPQEYARTIAGEMGASRSWELNIAVMLSRIGQIALPAETVTKLRSGRDLTKAEQEMVARIPETGRNLIGNIPRLERVSEAIYYQNKEFDGGGFPEDGPSGEEIPLAGRILKVVNDLTEAEAREGTVQAAFAMLEAHPLRYDPKILDIVRAKLLPQEDGDAGETALKPIEVPTYLIRAGDRLASDIRTTDGTLLLAAGMEISQIDLERLRLKREIVDTNPTVHVIRSGASPEDEDETEHTDAA